MGDNKLTGSTSVATPTRGLAGNARMTSKRRAHPAPRPAKPAKPEIKWSVTRHIGRRGYVIETPTIVDEAAVRKFLFTDGRLPSGFKLVREPWATLWTLTIPPGMAVVNEAAAFTKPLADAVLGNPNLLGIEPGPEQDYYREQENERRSQKLDFLGKPFTGTTTGEVLETWKSGWWETASHFVYLGFDPLYRTRVLVWCDVSKTSKRFNEDIKYYLSGNVGADGKTHTSLRDAIDTFQRDTMQQTNTILGAYALTLASAPGATSRPSGPAIKPLNVDTVIQVVGTAVNAYMAGQGAKSPLPPPDPVTRQALGVVGDLLWPVDDNEQFRIDVTQAVTSAGVQLMPKVRGQVRRLDLGNFGEAVVRQTLEMRGYEVLVLQNKSGHGLDIIAIKTPRSGKGPRLVLWGEVKTSEVGSFKLSKAQQNVQTYVVSRLERAANLYTNMTPAQKQVAFALLAEINSGAAVVTTGGKFYVGVDWTQGSLEIKTQVWKAASPKVSLHPAGQSPKPRPVIAP